MPSMNITRERYRQLDELGIDAVCELYVNKYPTVQKMCDDLFVPRKPGERVGRQALFAWLKKEPARWEAWVEAKKLKGEVIADEAYEDAMSVTEADVRSTKLKVEMKRWMAGHLNEEFSDKAQKVTVEHSLSHDWLKALQLTDRIEEAEVIEATLLPEKSSSTAQEGLYSATEGQTEVGEG